MEMGQCWANWPVVCSCYYQYMPVTITIVLLRVYSCQHLQLKMVGCAGKFLTPGF